MKKKKTLLAILLATFFSVAVGIIASICATPLSASAETETTKVYTLTFDYEYYVIYSYTYSGSFPYTSEGWTDGQYRKLTTGTDATTVPIMHGTSSTKDFSISIYGEVPNYTVEGETKPKDSYFNFNVVNIKVPSLCQGAAAGALTHDYRYRITQLSNSKGELLVNDKFKTKWSDQGPEVVFTGELPNDTYTLHFEYSNWKNDWIYYHKITTTFKIDKSAPTISGASTSTTGKYTNSAFTVTASDSGSGVSTLHWRDPSLSGYSIIYSSSKTIAAGSNNGLYRFYAIDKAGNKSSTYYVYYDNVLPVGRVTTSSGDYVESGGSTKEAFSFFATDSGSGISTLQFKTPSSTTWKTYIEGATIAETAELGTYSFKSTDKAGNTQVYSVTLLGPCADGHDFIAKIISPTCTSGGYTAYTCSRCGDSYTADATSVLGHSYSASTTTASCTSGGYTTYTCTRCGDTYTGNTTSATGHSYSAKVTTATCTSTGYTTYTCTKCGYSYKGNTTAALGHSYKAITSNSTCTEDGYTTYKCTRCGVSYTDSPTQATGHSYVASITEPTCTERGYTIFTCTKCGDSYRDNETGALGHNFQTKVISATCTAHGGTENICTRCGVRYRQRQAEPLGHSYVITTVSATCEDGGYSQHTCSRCGSSYTDSVTQPLGHNFITTTKDATCTEYGMTINTCQVCGYEYSDLNGVYPTGHSYTSTILKAATCTMDGERHYHCDQCGDEYSVVIPATGHNYAISDTVSENGVTTRTYTCTLCGDSYKQELGDQYEEVSSYVEYLFEQYRPYMWWVLLAAAGVWSIVMGVFFGIATRNEDKEKAKKMIVNYVIGLVIIAVILVACPYLISGIAALIT